MNKNIPKFNKLLKKQFEELALDTKGGLKRKCRFSGNEFYIRSEDIEFYKRINVPLPTLEPEERRRRRSAFHNSYNLFKIESSYSGERIVSMYPPGNPYKVYEHEVWYSDKWDPVKYGVEYNPKEPVFEQFKKLALNVPRSNLISDPSNTRSEYTNVSKNLKDCYLVFDQNGGDRLFYHQCCAEDKNCVDCWAIDFSDTCYECKLSQRLYKCFFAEESRNCMESAFLWDSRGCTNCFMSSNLRNQKYYFRNEYIGEVEYKKRIADIYFGDRDKLAKLKEEYKEMKLKAPRKPLQNEKSVNVVGNYIRNSKNIYYGLYIEDSENMAYSEGSSGSKDSYDLLGGAGQELCYEVANVWNGSNYNCRFSLNLESCREVEYSDFCRNSKNCFGCVGLDNKEFCVFNKQYSEDEYWALVDDIKVAMLERGEYGEFFPPENSPFPYKIATSSSYDGFRDFENAEKYGYDVSDVDYKTDVVEKNVIKASDLPADIEDVRDDILNKVIYDEKNDRYFRIIPQELQFYREHKFPVPQEHPSVRMQYCRDSFNLRLNFYDRICPKCGNKFSTTFAPDRPEIVYCQDCYQSEVL